MYVAPTEVDPVDSEDESYRNGPKGLSAGFSLANLQSGKRERKTRVLDVEVSPRTLHSKPKTKQKRMKKPKKKASSPAPTPERAMTFLSQGTASRGPLHLKPLSLAEMYPGLELEKIHVLNR